jgi:8-oxo-dGTP pyrophosphatase MutT (NUDIX family)
MPNLIDIVDKNNQLTGQTVQIDIAIQSGLWHRGVAVVVCTKTGYVIVQRRSQQMRMHPGMLDFSAGGFVDSGEVPEAAAVRELHEELGLAIEPTALHFIKIYRKNHAWPKRHGNDRVFIYCYALCLPNHDISLNVQASEVLWAKFIPKNQLKRLIIRHSLRSLGRLEPTYSYYKMLLAAAEPFMHT